MKSMFFSEWLKIKRTSVFWVNILFPFFMVGIMFIYAVGLHKKLLIQAGEFKTNIWSYSVVSSHQFIIFLLPIAITLSVASLTNLEHKTRSWKLLFTLPTTRKKIYLVKLLIMLVFQMILVCILFLGMIFIGDVMNYGGPIPYSIVFKEALFPVVAAFPFLVFQMWISMIIPNQGFSIAVGLIGTVAGIFFQMSEATKYLFWSYPSLVSPVYLSMEKHMILKSNDISTYILLSFIVGSIILKLGCRHFVKKEW